MLPADLPYYESSGKWLAQRKFNGSRCVLYISKDRYVSIGNRHGGAFARFTLTKPMVDEILSSLKLEDGKDYWLDGELLNKQENPSNEIILYDVLHAGRYLFGTPTQIDRLEILHKICGAPASKCESGIALRISERLRMAESFLSGFHERFADALPSELIEGLVLRKRTGCLDSYGDKEYETSNLIRCRRPFSKDKGYDF